MDHYSSPSAPFLQQVDNLSERTPRGMPLQLLSLDLLQHRACLGPYPLRRISQLGSWLDLPSQNNIRHRYQEWGFPCRFPSLHSGRAKTKLPNADGDSQIEQSSPPPPFGSVNPSSFSSLSLEGGLHASPDNEGDASVYL